ncbi:ribonuclease D [Spirulina subsalsa FACHB-351]|uniref:Ribonuclease D n=1 Tax=Spirulina subsalsa FACHB-351 TaxID=234711 RepID=A0ABT3L9D4_9CYAN|nr:ribonuclease D [Spirulina subsalsa]MCW6038104.1 ribonuclease D [Spirulina subsalsa FACHB-351]
MNYLTDVQEIEVAIAQLAQAETLWLDTEVADYDTKKPRLSLIQILSNPHDITGDTVTVLDVLDSPPLANLFIAQIMQNPDITKVFHNANYDCRFLGKKTVKAVVCTLKMARDIPYYLLPLSHHNLATLTEYFCPAFSVDKSPQGSDWGQRPLSSEQLHYAALDVVYLAQVYQHLRKLHHKAHPDPKREDITALTLRYRQIEHQWGKLTTEYEHLRDRIKAAMISQNVTETNGFKLSPTTKTTRTIAFSQLAQAMEESQVDWDFPITLTKAIQEQIGAIIEELPIQEQVTQSQRLNIAEQSDEEMPF